MNEHECERIELINGVIKVPESIEEEGECSQGCCTYYRCKLCGDSFKVEWPD